MVPKQTKIVPKRIKFVRKNYIVIPILSVISDGGAETDQRGAKTEKFVPKTPKLEVPKKVPKRVASYLTKKRVWPLLLLEGVLLVLRRVLPVYLQSKA